MKDITPITLVVTGRRQEFIDQLEPGDVLLFQGADFLAGLAQLTERRTAYHSAIYLGHRVLAHNVSMLWWRDTASRVPGNASLTPADGGVKWRDNLVDNHLVDLASHPRLQSLAQLHTANPSDHAARLLGSGGVGAVSLDSYLDRSNAERLYGDATRYDTVSPVHHIRSVTALRHHSVDLENPASAAEVSTKLLAHVVGAGDKASGFDAGELVSHIPDIADRPGYLEWHKLRQLSERHSTDLAKLFYAGVDDPAEKIFRDALGRIPMFPSTGEGPGWICASFVAEVYSSAGYDLALETVDDVELGAAPPIPLSTPRDLWDAERLTPIALLARGPERWDHGPGLSPPTIQDPGHPRRGGEPQTDVVVVRGAQRSSIVGTTARQRAVAQFDFLWSPDSFEDLTTTGDGSAETVSRVDELRDDSADESALAVDPRVLVDQLWEAQASLMHSRLLEHQTRQRLAIVEQFAAEDTSLSHDVVNEAVTTAFAEALRLHSDELEGVTSAEPEESDEHGPAPAGA